MIYPTNMLVYRNRARITQGALAKAVGVSQPRISNVESCIDDTAPANLLSKIAKAISFPGNPQELQSQYVGPNPTTNQSQNNGVSLR